MSSEDRGEFVRGPGLGLAAAGRVEGMRGRPHVLGDVDEVEQDMNLGASAGGFVVDEVELVAGAVDEHDPVPQMLRVSGGGLGEGVGHDLLRGMDHRGGAPPVLRFRARPWCPALAAAAGWVDYVVRPARGGRGVEDAGHRRHPLAVGLLAGGEPPAPPGCRALGRGLAGGLAQGLGTHHHPLAVDLDDQGHLAGAGGGDLRRVVGGDVDGGGGHQLFEAAFAQYFPAALFDRGSRLVEGASHRFQDREAGQATGVPTGGQ